MFAESNIQLEHLGALPESMATQIQHAVDTLGLSIYVVGGYALGKEGKPRKDIDYIPGHVYDYYKWLDNMHLLPTAPNGEIQILNWNIQNERGYLFFQPEQPAIYSPPTPEWIAKLENITNRPFTHY